MFMSAFFVGYSNNILIISKLLHILFGVFIFFVVSLDSTCILNFTKSPIMKTLPLLISFLVLFVQANAQSISSLSSELYSLQSKCRNAFSNNSSVDDLEDELDDIHRKVSYLVDEIEDLDDDDKRASEYKTLLLDAEELEDFTADNNTCECLKSFKKLIGYLGASGGMLMEKDAVRIMQADLGNFKLYYAYGLQKKLYKVNVEMQFSKGSTFLSGSSKFGLANEIEVLKIAPKSENWKITSMIIEISNDLNYVPEKCGNEYPRY
jgi:hypothetical protein